MAAELMGMTCRICSDCRSGELPARTGSGIGRLSSERRSSAPSDLPEVSLRDVICTASLASSPIFMGSYEMGPFPITMRVRAGYGLRWGEPATTVAS